MAAKLRKVMKRDVVALREGRNLGKPDDILIDPVSHTVAYVLVNRGGVDDTALVVPASGVKSFLTDTLAIESLDDLQIAGRNDHALDLVKRGWPMRKRPVVTNEGTKLGKVANVMVDERGVVIEYRVRKGLLGFLRPKVRLDPATMRSPGSEVLVARDPKRPGAD